MKLVTFQVNGPTGVQRRLGALQDERIVDLTTAYATYLAQRTDEPTPRELAQLRTPPDLIGFLRAPTQVARGGASRHWPSRATSDPDARRIDARSQLCTLDEVKLLAPLPRPNSLRDFSIFEEHMTRREGGGVPKRPNWYRWPPYYKGNPDRSSAPKIRSRSRTTPTSWTSNWRSASSSARVAAISHSSRRRSHRRLHDPDRLQRA